MSTVTLTGAPLARFLRSDDLNAIRVALRHEHPADIVGVIGDMPSKDMGRIRLCLDELKQATLFGNFSNDTQKPLAGALDLRDMARILGAMAHDERADRLAELEGDQKNALLRSWPRPSARTCASWPPVPKGRPVRS